jgi:hypothetical protein
MSRLPYPQDTIGHLRMSFQHVESDRLLIKGGLCRRDLLVHAPNGRIRYLDS